MHETFSQAVHLFQKGRSLAIGVLMCTLIVSFGHQAVRGDHGLERRAQIKQRIAEMEVERDRLIRKRDRLEHKVTLLRVAKPRPTDLAEQQARALLNLARPGEIIIIDLPKDAE